MATRKIRYFVEKKNAGGGARHYWQPSAALESQGWRTRRLADDPAAALGEAETLNRTLDDWRRGAAPGMANAVRVAGAAPTATRPRAVVAAGATAKSVTVDRVIVEYKATPRWGQLAASTRRTYTEDLDAIARWAGDQPILAIDEGLVDDWYEALYARAPRLANRTADTLGRLFKLARRRRWVRHNPLDGLDRLTVKTAEARIWSRAEVTHMVATADALGRHSVGDAILLNELLGQRMGDLIEIQRAVEGRTPNVEPRCLYAAGLFRIRQSKTGARVNVPHSPAVAARLADAIDRQEKAGVVSTYLLLDESTGQPYQADSLARAFREVRAAAAKTMPGCAELWFMRLRHTAVTRMGEAGVPLQRLAAVTGHSFKTCQSILDRYMDRTSEMASQAVAQRLKYEDERGGDDG